MYENIEKLITFRKGNLGYLKENSGALLAKPQPIQVAILTAQNDNDESDDEVKAHFQRGNLQQL